MRRSLLLLCALAGGCATGAARATREAGPAPAPAQAPAPARQAAGESSSVDRPQYPSTYQRHPNPPVLIRNATIMTAAGPEIPNGSILFKDGRIVAVGAKVDAPSDAVVVVGAGKYVTPGLIDEHSHLGVYAAPGTDAESDGNEATTPVTAEVWAEHSFWPQDPQIPLAIAGGITTIQALPGSANLIGGRSAILKLIPARTVQEMKFPGARYGLKMACGENPKRVYRMRGGPSTRMGNMAGYRAAFIQAELYRRKWDAWNKDHKGDPPERNLRSESLAEVLRGNMYVQNHCYRADEMAQMIDHLRHLVGAVAVVLHVHVAAQHFSQRFRPEVSLGRIALVVLVPGVPPAPIGLRQDERRAVARHVAHAGGRPAAPTVHAFGVLAAGHLQSVVRARKLHFLHGARRDELQDRTAPADQVRRARQRLDRGDPAGDGQRDLRVLRPERVLRPHGRRHRVRRLVAVRLGIGPRRGVHAEVRVVVDQPGRHVLARSVNHHGVARGVDLRAHRDDPPILEQDRAVGNLLPGRGHDRGVADQDRRIGMPHVGGRVLWSRDARGFGGRGRGCRGRGRLRRAGAPPGRRARAGECEQQK